MEKILEILIDSPDYEWLMIDASHVKVHPHTAGAKGARAWVTQKGASKIHLAVDAHGMPVRIIITSGAVTDCTQAVPLIDGIAAQFLLADRGYDSNEIIDKAIASGCKTVIPPRRNRKEQRFYDKYIYRIRHLVENAFLHPKRWRGVATRYAKTLASFAAAVQIRCIALWLNVLA